MGEFFAYGFALSTNLYNAYSARGDTSIGNVGGTLTCTALVLLLILVFFIGLKNRNPSFLVPHLIFQVLQEISELQPPSLKATQNPKMKWVSDERALAGE